MPKYQHRVDLHRLFLVERRGDTLIVSPKGDPAGFSELDFSREHAGLLSLLNQEKPWNVLVDFSSSNYFGAKMLGALSEWAIPVQAHNAKFAICALSDDMKELLRIFNLEDRWSQYPNRVEGIKAVVTETRLETFRQHGKQVALLVCVLLCLGVLSLPWRTYYEEYINQRDYDTVAAFWEEMQELKAANAPPTACANFKTAPGGSWKR